MEELDNLILEYARTFGEGFPTFQLFRSRTTEECIELIKKCLNEKKTAYDLGLVTDEEDTLY